MIERWQDRWFTGHVSFLRLPSGRKFITIYGANAMHWAIDIWFFGQYYCFHPTTKTFGCKWPWYFYISKDATPFNAWGIGPGFRN